MDAPSSVLGQARVEQPGNPPFHFTIQYDPTQVQPNHTYVVRARLLAGERLLFTTDQRYQVLTQGHGSEIDTMVLRRVSGSSAQADSGSAALRKTYWKLVRIGERSITPADQQQEAHLVFQEDGRVTGSGGCNRLSGGYTLDGNSLSFTGVASTRMACMRGMETESSFLAALEHVQSWKISNGQLELVDEDGKMLLRFTAQSVKTK
jgi:putative lipoprotein